MCVYIFFISNSFNIIFYISHVAVSLRSFFIRFILIIIRMYHSHGTGSLFICFVLSVVREGFHSGFTVHATCYWIGRFFCVSLPFFSLSSLLHICRLFHMPLLNDPILYILFLFLCCCCLFVCLSWIRFCVITISVLQHCSLPYCKYVSVFFRHKYVWCSILDSYICKGMLQLKNEAFHD